MYTYIRRFASRDATQPTLTFYSDMFMSLNNSFRLADSTSYSPGICSPSNKMAHLTRRSEDLTIWRNSLWPIWRVFLPPSSGTTTAYQIICETCASPSFWSSIEKTLSCQHSYRMHASTGGEWLYWNGNVILRKFGCVESCPKNNFRCSQWWKFHQNDFSNKAENMLQSVCFVAYTAVSMHSLIRLFEE